MSAAPPSLISVTTASRPKRIAILFNPNTVTSEELDGIFDKLHLMWGGRLCPIIPTDGNTIEEEWWNLLLMVDPDYVHSLQPLSDDLVRQLNRRILPAKITEVTKADRDRNHVQLVPYIETLGVGEIPQFAYARRGVIEDLNFLCLMDSNQKSAERSFFVRNFGLLPNTVGTPRAFEGVPHQIVEQKGLSPEGLFSLLLEHRRPDLVFPNALGQMYAWRSFFLMDDGSNNELHIVIGDSPLDLIYSWNRVLTGAHWQRSHVYWVSEAQAKDPTLLAKLKEWIDRTYWGSDTHSGRILSYSVDVALMNEVAATLKCGACWHLKTQRLSADKLPCPKWNPVPQAFQRFDPPKRTDLVSLSAKKGIVHILAPPFLEGTASQGGWMVDFDIQSLSENINGASSQREWRLPKRVGVSHAFFNPYRESRIIRDGRVSASVNMSEEAVGISIPSDREVVWCCCFPQYASSENPRPLCKSRFSDIATSSNGRYLRGLIQLFSNLQLAGHVFEDPFWRQLIVEMAGRPEDDFQQRTQKASAALHRVLSEEDITLTSKNISSDVVAKCVNAFTLRDSESKELTLKQLQGHFQKLRSQALKNRPSDSWWNNQSTSKEHLDHDLPWLLEAGVFFQGSKLRCQVCGSKQWYPVDRLTHKVRCEGCLSEFPLPVAPEWSFRLNSLVANAVRKHGLLAVLAALNSQQRWVRHCFLYLPCQDLFEKHQTNAFTDLDLVVIKDGRFMIGEVKTAPEGFKQDQFDKLAIAASELLPDEVIVAAIGCAWPDQVKREIDGLTRRLAPLGITVTAQLLEWDQCVS